MKYKNRYPSIAIYVAKDQGVDARAFPGGTIVVTTGLLEFAESEAALVGILGHELSHIDHGHQLRTVRALKLAQSSWAQAFERPGGIQRQIQTMTSNFARPYRSEDEEVADSEGATWAFELGYDPMQMAALFRRLDGVTAHAPATLPNFLRTHPYNADRYAAIKKLTLSLQRGNPRNLIVGSECLRARTPKSMRN
jgi:predicted Zn-dependent protease